MYNPHAYKDQSYESHNHQLYLLLSWHKLTTNFDLDDRPLQRINIQPSLILMTYLGCTKCPTNRLFFQARNIEPDSKIQIRSATPSQRLLYAAITAELAKRLDIAPARVPRLFYESQTCADPHNKKTGLYLFGNLYIADEFIREYEYKM